jgi:COMPASS component SWD3
VKFIEYQGNELLISGGWDSNVYIWDLKTGKSIGNINGPKISGDSLDFKNGLILVGSARSSN